MSNDVTVSPDEAAFLADLKGVAFRVGNVEGRWGLVDHSNLIWPFAVFWIAAPVRASSPDRFHVRLDLSGYPSQSPTGRFWDVTAGTALALKAFPKGTGDTGKVFRTDWPGEDPGKGDTPGSALYHPFDLEMIYDLLNSPTYTGIA
jgi:hypothetical protein